MKEEDINKIEQIIVDRQHAHQFYTENSGVYREFEKLQKEAFKSGHLHKKHKELIALGISIKINCESCMEWHIKQALDNGATRDEILETIEVGIEMGGGPATVASRFALSVLEFYLDR